MTLSTRVSIQWPPELADEATKTLVLTTPENHFVDIRTFKEYYCPKSGNGLPFDKVFEWCLSGIEEEIKGTSKIQFNQEINSIAIAKSLKNNEPLKFGLPDIGDFSSIEGSDDRKEIGSMENPNTGKVQDYIEIWRSLDPIENSPETEVIEKGSKFEVFTLVIDNEKHTGKLIRLGNWVQGLLYDKTKTSLDEQVLHVVQSYLKDGERTDLVSYGSTQLFPVDFSGSVGDSATALGLLWRCIEQSP